MTTTYKIGDLVWAKMKGFPKWPGVVAEPTRELKASKKANFYCIYFFGSNNYAWIEPKALDPYNDGSECKTKSGAFKDAIAAIEAYKVTGEGGPVPEDDVEEEGDPFDQLIGEASTSGEKKKGAGKKRRISKEGSEAPSTDGEGSAKSFKLKAPKKSAGGTPKAARPKKSLEGHSAKKRKTENFDADTTTNETNRGRKSLIDRPYFRADSPTLDVTSVSQTLLNKQVVPSNKVFGFIGLGVMGSGLVKNLLNSKHEVHVWDRAPDRSQGFARVGAKLCMTPQDVMCAADIVFSCVSDPEVAKSMVFGNCGVLPEVNSTKSFVEMSGIDPVTSSSICQAITDHGGRYLEAQLQGSKSEAEEGTVVILAAGDRSLFNDVSSCFEAIGRASFFLGETGAATKMNLVLQQYYGIALAGLAECMAFAERCGLNQHEVLEVLNITSMASPMLQDKGRAIADCSFNTNMALKYMQKDMGLVMRLAETQDQPLPLSSVAHQVYVHAKRFGYADHDASSVYISARF